MTVGHVDFLFEHTDQQLYFVIELVMLFYVPAYFVFRIYEEIQKIEANEFHYQEQVVQHTLTHTHTL